MATQPTFDYEPVHFSKPEDPATHKYRLFRFDRKLLDPSTGSFPIATLRGSYGTCAVCSNLLVEPVGLVCTHCACTPCFLTLPLNEGGAVCCPRCKDMSREVEVHPNHAISNLCENFFAEEHLEAMEHLEAAKAHVIDLIFGAVLTERVVYLNETHEFVLKKLRERKDETASKRFGLDPATYTKRLHDYLIAGLFSDPYGAFGADAVSCKEDPSKRIRSILLNKHERILYLHSTTQNPLQQFVGCIERIVGHSNPQEPIEETLRTKLVARFDEEHLSSEPGIKKDFGNCLLSQLSDAPYRLLCTSILNEWLGEASGKESVMKKRVASSVV